MPLKMSWLILISANLKRGTWRVLSQLTLIAYKVENDSIVLYQVGPHENFYKNLKKYLKETGG